MRIWDADNTCLRCSVVRREVEEDEEAKNRRIEDRRRHSMKKGEKGRLWPVRRRGRVELSGTRKKRKENRRVDGAS
jgi:hypothetical protein